MIVTVVARSEAHHKQFLSVCFQRLLGVVKADRCDFLRAAQQLNRYGLMPSNSMLVEMADRLLADPEPEVRTAAWQASADLGLPRFAGRATAVLKGADEQPLVRLAAAHYLLAASSIVEGAD